ncbi:MAG: galactonate dehydratase [Verrucomicrobiota bacterium]|nr:galactonate dehydratase [Verrucomicrobiota bacterium]
MKKNTDFEQLSPVRRRAFIGQLFAAAGFAAAGISRSRAAEQAASQPYPGFVSPHAQEWGTFKPEIRITRLETFLIKPRWLFLKVHTDAGIIGLGEPITEGRAKTCAAAVAAMEPYLLGRDPRHVVHHWQALYRHTFYRGGPVLTSALSGVEQALWDIKGKALGVPVYELLGGPTRDRIRVYAHVGNNPETIKKRKAEGFTAFKTGVYSRAGLGVVASQADIEMAGETFARIREAGGKDVDIGIDFHGAISPQNAKLLIKVLEPYQPLFIEEPVQCQNVDVMAEIARGTHLPIATGERIFTKWGFREILEKGAANILQPDLCHAGGILETRLIAGMAEAYYASIAPHNPLGPISLAAGLQLAASIPNFLCQEQVSLGDGYLKEPFKVEAGYVKVPTAPGLGIELDEEAIQDKLGHDWQNPQTYDRRDGSVVDW